MLYVICFISHALFLFFRELARTAREAALEQPALDVQHPGASRRQRVRAARGQVRAHSAADHRCGEHKPLLS